MRSLIRSFMISKSNNDGMLTALVTLAVRMGCLANFAWYLCLDQP